MSEDLASSPSARATVLALRARRREVAQAIEVRMQEVVPDPRAARDAGYRAGRLAAIAAVLEQGLQTIEAGSRFTGPIPLEAAEQARRAARTGVGVGTVLRSYLAGHRRLGEFLAEESERGLVSDRSSMLLYARHALDLHLERLMAAIEREYERERERIVRTPEQRRVELIRSLIEDVTDKPPGFDALRYRFDVWHVGVIAIGSNARHVVAALDVDRQLLRVSPDDETVWAWLGGRRHPNHGDMERLRETAHASGRVSVAIGEPGSGLDGWRRTHTQAQQAMRVALLTPDTPIRYADVALLTPWLEDGVRARQLIQIYLSPLDSQRDQGATSRRTLQAYFQAGRNVSTTARCLGVDRRTVTYRLRTIEECLGYTVQSRLTELEVALRLRELIVT